MVVFRASRGRALPKNATSFFQGNSWTPKEFENMLETANADDF